MLFLPKYIARLALIGASLLTACKTTTNVDMHPALITRMNPTTQEALTLAVSKAVGAKVTLAPDSFMEKPSVTIEPPSVNKRNGQIIDGRSQEMPTHVDLMMIGKDCYVVNRTTGKKHPIKGLACKVLNTP